MKASLRFGGLVCLSLILLACGPTCQEAGAKFIRPDIEQVPVARLVENLQKQVAAKPDDVDAKINLARLHAMAFSLKTDTATVWKGRESQGPWYGYTPKPIPFAVAASDDPRKQEAAKEHLKEAIDLYKKAVEQAPDNLIALLGQAWTIEQSGDKKQAIELYRKLIEKAWAKEKDLKRAGMGFHAITGEAGGYLVPLLDKDKDAEEIGRIKARSEQLARLPRPITPIVVPLRNGLKATDLVDQTAGVRFDADGTGLEKSWTWITPDAGWLVYDPTGTGRVDSALQLFGNVSFWLFWENGYQALGALDDNGDGVLTGRELKGLAIWRDANRNGRVDPSEIQPLSFWGVTSISCRYERGQTGSGIAAFSGDGVQFQDGKTRATYDIILESR